MEGWKKSKNGGDPIKSYLFHCCLKRCKKSEQFFVTETSYNNFHRNRFFSSCFNERLACSIKGLMRITYLERDLHITKCVEKWFLSLAIYFHSFISILWIWKKNTDTFVFSSKIQNQLAFRASTIEACKSFITTAWTGPTRHTSSNTRIDWTVVHQFAGSVKKRFWTIFFLKILEKKYKKSNHIRKSFFFQKQKQINIEGNLLSLIFF